MRRNLSIAIIIIVTSFCAHLLNLPVFFGISINLSLIGYMLAVRFLPLHYAVITSTLISTLIFFESGNLRFAITALIHTIILALFYNRKKKDLFTWTFLTVLILASINFLFNYFYLGFDELNFLIFFVYIQHSILYILIALFIDLVTVYFPYMPYLRKGITLKRPIFFGQVIFNVIVVVAILPLILITGMNIYIKYSETVNYYEERAASFDNVINEYINRLDEREVQRFLLGSTVERGFFNQLIDQFVANTDATVYVFNEDQSLFTHTADAIDYRFLDQKMKRGYIIELSEHQDIWIDSTGEAIHNWYNGHFLHRTTILDKDIHLIMPLPSQFIPFVSELFLYYLLILIVFFSAFIFGLIADGILTRQLSQLNTLASKLPSTMLDQNKITVPVSRIFEFSQLAVNIGIVGDRLKKMFLQLEEKTEQLQKSEQALYQVAHHDNLTLLPNRRSFYLDLEDLLEQRIDQFAILFIDFDKFKLVNDTYGHSSGDQLLIDIADRFRALCDDCDQLSFYRLAGDEFIAVVRHREYEDIKQLGELILTELSKPFKIKGDDVYISASIGVSLYPKHGDSIDALLNAADQAMYELKNKEKKGINFAPERGN